MESSRTLTLNFLAAARARVLVLGPRLMGFPSKSVISTGFLVFKVGWVVIGKEVKTGLPGRFRAKSGQSKGESADLSLEFENCRRAENVRVIYRRQAMCR